MSPDSQGFCKPINYGIPLPTPVACISALASVSTTHLDTGVAVLAYTVNVLIRLHTRTTCQSIRLSQHIQFYQNQQLIVASAIVDPLRHLRHCFISITPTYSAQFDSVAHAQSQNISFCLLTPSDVVRVAPEVLLKLNNNYLQDGRFLLEFFVCHPPSRTDCTMLPSNAIGSNTILLLMVLYSIIDIHCTCFALLHLQPILLLPRD